MRFFAFIVVSVWLGLAAPLRAAEPLATLPYRVDYAGWITVDVMVNGKGPYDFILDTGSTITFAFDNLALEQGFAPTGGENLRVLGISAEDELTPYHIGNVAVGAARLDDHIGVVLPDWAPPRRTPHGVIGLDFLREYAVYFDYASRTMTLYPHGGVPRARTRELRRVKLAPRDFGKASGALFTTDGLINRKPTTFIVDLGSVSTLINYEAAEAIFSSVMTRDLGEGFTTGSRLKDIFDDRARARTALINRIQIGRVSWRRHGVWVFNSPLFDELDVQRLPFGLAGVDLLADRDFALDFGENEMYIARRPSPAAR